MTGQISEEEYHSEKGFTDASLGVTAFLPGSLVESSTDTKAVVLCTAFIPVSTTMETTPSLQKKKVLLMSPRVSSL